MQDTRNWRNFKFFGCFRVYGKFPVTGYQKFLKRVSEQEFYCIDPSKLKIAMNFKEIDTPEVSHSIKFPIDPRKDLFFPQVAKKT